MQHLAMFLGLMPGINTGVVDRTGLTGGYDIDLEFTGGMFSARTPRRCPPKSSIRRCPPFRGLFASSLGYDSRACVRRSRCW